MRHQTVNDVHILGIEMDEWEDITFDDDGYIEIWLKEWEIE